MPPESSVPSLLRLPIEIRLQIYYYCIPRKRIVEVANPRFNTQWFSMDRTLGFKAVRNDTDSENLFGDTDSDDEWGFNAVRNLNFLDDADITQDETSLDDVQDLEDVSYDPIIEWEDCNLRLNSDYWNPNDDMNSVFLVSKQISEEALDILYGENIFKLYLHGEGEYTLRENFTDRNRQRMKYLLIIAQPRGVSYTPDNTFDDTLWCSILPHLNGLRMILEQPLEAGHYYNAPTLESEMDRWVNWIRPLLQCFGRHLLIQTEVQIDYDGRAETGALAKECLPHGYREIRCRHVGDLVFKRGQFSWESGYWSDDDPINSRDANGDWGSD